MPSLMAARWVGQNSVLLFAVCRPKYTKLPLPVRECLQFAKPFSDWWCLVAFRRYSRSSREVVRNRAEILMFLGRQISGGGTTSRPPKFLTEFYKSGSSPNMWQSLVTIGQATTSEIRRRKKKDLNYNGKTMAGGQDTWRTAIITVAINCTVPVIILDGRSYSTAAATRAHYCLSAVSWR